MSTYRKSLAIGWLAGIVGLSGGVSPALAAAPARPVTPPATETAASAPPPLVLTKAFSDLGTESEPLRLSTWQSGYTLKLPFSPREDLSSVKLSFETANSTALIRSRSELSVRVNGQVLAQYPLDPVKTINRRELDIPVSLLKAGYNDVNFSVVQHYTYDCEDPASPELWTEINTRQSFATATFRGFRPNLDPRLSQLHVAFDRRGWIQRPLSVVTGTEHVSEAQTAAAALAVQGMALRLGYRPMDISVHGASTGSALRPEATRFPGLSSAVTQGRDVLLVGRRAELSRYFDSELYGVVTGPFVGTFAANGGDSVITVISGNTDAELMRAARSLAEPDFKFSDVPMETITGEWAFKRPYVAVPAEPAAFSKFDFRTTGSRGAVVRPLQFDFRAPADYGARKGDLASVKLHFSYGAGLRQDSSMTVSLNGHFAVAVPLSDPSGTEYQKYEVKVPAQYIKPGANRLVFEPVFVAHKGRCEMTRDEGMVLTVYEDSTIELPRPTVAPAAPDLRRFSQAFWPHEDMARLYLTQRDTRTVGAALQLVASMAQKNKAPFDVQVSYSPYPTGHMLTVGPLGAGEDFVSQALPLSSHTWSADGGQAGVLQAVEGGRVITAFTAPNASVMKTAVQQMDSFGLWQSLEGRAALINTNERTVQTEPAQVRVDFGPVRSFSAGIVDWKLLAVLVAALAGGFSLAFMALLRRHAKKREER